MGAAAAPIMGLEGAGALVGAYGQIQAGRANSAIDLMNAQYARQQEAQALESGEYQAGVRDLKGSLLAGQQAAGFASQGVVSGAGSAGTAVAASEAMTDADKAMIRLNARRTAYGFEASALNDEFQASMARRGSYMGAATSVLAGAGQMAFTGATLGGGSGGGAAADPESLAIADAGGGPFGR